VQGRDFNCFVAEEKEEEEQEEAMSTPDHAREPCPDRILDDIGGAFSMGAVGGSAFHFIKGMKNSPKGERLLGGTQAVRLNAPRIGGSFAVWGGLFSTFDCSMVFLRQKEDPWNSIAAGAATGGFLSLRAGARSAARSAVFGGVLLGLIEGAGIMLNRMMANMAQPPPLEDMPPIPAGAYPAGAYPEYAAAGGPSYAQSSHPDQASSSSSSSGGFFSGWFGGQKEEPEPVRSEKLDSFDANPAPPTPGFDLK
jgi:import inner membrane translocase subunit TIM17